MAYSTIDLLRNAASNPQFYRRLLVLLTILGLLMALGCVLGVVWLVDWPQFPELPIPMTMF